MPGETQGGHLFPTFHRQHLLPGRSCVNERPSFVWDVGSWVQGCGERMLRPSPRRGDRTPCRRASGMLGRGRSNARSPETSSVATEAHVPPLT